MAIRGTDGSIILTTKIDEKGITKGTNSIKTAFDKVNNYLENVGAKIGNNFTKVGSSIKNTFTKLTTSLKGLAGQILAFFSIRALLQFSNEASKKASTTEASVQRLIDIYAKASIAVGDFIDQNAHALGLSRAAATEFSAVYGNLFSVWADQETNARLTTQYLNATAVVASKTGRTMQDVQERIRSGLLGNTEAVEDLGIFVNIKTIEMTEAFQRVAQGAKWDSLSAAQQSQVRTLAILEQATKKYGTEVANTTALTRAQYNAAFQDFQNTWGRIVNLVLMPILRIATRILNTLTAGLRVLAGLSGKTIDNNKQFEEQTDHIGGAVDNQEALTEAVKDTTKEQKKLLAGFDDLEILSQKAASGGSGGAGSVGGVSGLEGLDVLGAEIDEAEYTSKLALIGMVTGWALVGLGIIVMFSGHPLLGVGMVASGFVLSAGAAEGGTELGEAEKQKLINIGTITGVALLGLGTLVLFTKFWKLGLGMITTGASAIYSALTLGEFSQDVKQKVTDILLLTGTVLLVLGTILLFIPGAEGFGLKMLAMGATELFTVAVMNWEEIKSWVTQNCWVLVEEIGKFIFLVGIILLFVPNMMYIGFAAMVAGIAILGIGTITPNYEAIKNEISKFFEDNWKAIALVSTVLLILGIILMFSGHPGIGFSLVGAASVGLWHSVVPNWTELKTNIKVFFRDNWEAIAATSAALVVLGVLLCIAQLWGIGLTMIGIGAAGLYGVTAANWDAVKTTISNFITENYEVIVGWSAALLVLGTVLLFVPGCLGVGLTLLGLGATGIWASSKVDSSALSNKLTTELDKVNASAKSGVNKINTTLSGINPPTGGTLNATTFTIPKLARGTVLPGGKPFMAIVNDQPAGQTNIEAPLQTIVDAFNVALDSRGGAASSGNTEVILEIDGREFGRAVVEQGNKENRRIGTRLVIA